MPRAPTSWAMSDAGFSDAVGAAKKSDIVVLALGEDAAWMTGEARLAGPP